VFAGLGIWLGLKLTRHRETVLVKEVLIPAPAHFVRDEQKLESLGITPRELEILELIAHGLSNKEIAAKVFVSENTVKTHSSRVFDKLGARRRTQAVQLGKDLRLIP
jgi:two-component system, NarL family, response regulator LiaR